MNLKTEELANTRLDNRYQLGRLIGKGGMGVVYEGEHVILGRKVAVKCLHPKHLDEPDALKRFQREAQLAGNMGHENICDVIDFGVGEGEVPYLVMPLLNGASLETLFRSRLLSLERLVDIVQQTLSALKAAERARIVHRDLKPDNIFVVADEGGGDLVKLLDFGISKVLSQDTVVKLTKTGAILGTPHYMSPEQASGVLDLDHRTDIYATGAILYEGLTGQCPYDGDSYNEIIIKIVNTPFPMPRSINPLIPSSIEQVVLKAMAKDPLERFSCAADMSAALKTAFQESDVDSSKPITTIATTAVGDQQLFTPSGFDGRAPSSGYQSHADSGQSTGDQESAPIPTVQKGSLKRRYILVPLLLALIVFAVVLAVAYLRTPKTVETVPLTRYPTPTEPTEQTNTPNPSDLKPSTPRLVLPKELEPQPAGKETETEKKSNTKKRSIKKKRTPKGETKDLKKKPAQETPASKESTSKPKEKTGITKRGIVFEDQYD